MQDNEPLNVRLNKQTATIKWSEIQSFHAKGQAIRVASDLDLIEVAVAFAEDQVECVKGWMEAGTVAMVTDAEADGWAAEDAVVWAVVVAPWVLVQTRVAH